MKIIPYGKQEITDADIEATVRVLRSDYLTQGPEIREFETAFAAYTGAAYAVAVANGTAALHLAAMALGVEAGQKVITTPITFAASANCVEYCGAEAVFSDIDPETYLLDLTVLRQQLLADKSIKGIIPVQFAGRMVDMEQLRQLADEFGLWIIEDACHAPGAYFSDSSGTKHYAGNGVFAECSVFSFHPVKHIAAGEGGMITTNDKALYDRLCLLRTHGITRNTELFQHTPEAIGGEQDFPLWYMEMQELGYNYRLTDFQAALGRSQLARADEGLKKRRAIAARYAEAFAGESFVYGQSGSVEGHAYHLYILEVADRLGLYNYLRTKGIYVQIHYIPCHLMPYYRNKKGGQKELPVAEAYYQKCISLPMYPTLTEEEQQFVIQTVKSYYE
ncbi:MAG TPA: UDP-4-amino-4,6-dideoxy-N-acetyl-beta-L-altrosamine transaminase [Fluviicola sp.]|nr:UDP-4-amino-4,6-dideoxy-N-acetyl-beta-L-altrosamine transaminase [Fluviicola sp.]